MGWLIFGPVIAFFLYTAFYTKVSREDFNGLLFASFMFFIINIFVFIFCRATRLELTTEGIRLRQTGYKLETTWSNLQSVYSAKSHEGLVTNQPMTGKGAKFLAGFQNSGGWWGAFYDDEQRVLLDEKRLIPIEAFAWHLRKGGQRLREDLLRYAPQLESSLKALDRRQTP